MTDSFLNEFKNGEVGEGRGQTPKCLAYPIFDSETFRNGTLTSILDSETFRNGYAVTDSFLNESRNGEVVGEGRSQTPKCLAYPIFDS